jgi:hypothetical protein
MTSPFNHPKIYDDDASSCVSCSKNDFRHPSLQQPSFGQLTFVILLQAPLLAAFMMWD